PRAPPRCTRRKGSGTDPDRAGGQCCPGFGRGATSSRRPRPVPPGGRRLRSGGGASGPPADVGQQLEGRVLADARRGHYFGPDLEGVFGPVTERVRTVDRMTPAGCHWHCPGAGRGGRTRPHIVSTERTLDASGPTAVPY